MMPPLELVAHLLISFRRAGHAWRIEQLMPSVLFDNDARASDLGVTLEDLHEARQRRTRGR
jgi:hypothetical protein